MPELMGLFCAQVGTIGPSDKSGTFVDSGFHTEHYSHVQTGHFQHPSYIVHNLQDQPLHFQSPQEKHAVIQCQQLQAPPVHLQGTVSQPKIFSQSIMESSQRRSGKLQILTNPRIISTLGVANKAISSDSAQSRTAYVAVSGKKSSKDASNDSMLQVRFFHLNAY
jgi:hypothetical protein